MIYMVLKNVSTSNSQVTRLARPNFPVQLTSSRVGDLTWLIYTLAICVIIREYGDEQADAGRYG